MTIDAGSRRKSLTCTMIGGSTGIAQSTKQIHGRSALSYKLEITILLKKNPRAGMGNDSVQMHLYKGVLPITRVSHHSLTCNFPRGFGPPKDPYTLI